MWKKLSGSIRYVVFYFLHNFACVDFYEKFIFFFKYLVQHATLCMISSFDVSAKQRKLQKNQTEDKAFTIHLINLYISFSVSNLILR